MVDIAQARPSDMSPAASATGARPQGTMTYDEAAEATGVSRRHLRRLVADGKLEAVDMGGRRWVATSSLLAAGYQLRGPSGWADREDTRGDKGKGHPGGPSPDIVHLVEELETLRRRVAVAEALADERARELDRLHTLATRAMAMLPPAGGTTTGDTVGDVPRTPPKRWFRRRPPQ